MIDVLQLLADSPSEVQPISVEVVQGQALKFSRPKEGELEAVQAEANREVTFYYPEGGGRPAAWAPERKESFVSATILARFAERREDQEEADARRLLCQVARNKPTLFKFIWTEFIKQTVTGEVLFFQEEVERLKKSFETTESDSSV